MKKILLLILFSWSVSLFAATSYHAEVNGNDTTGNGSIGTPYRSLYKCSQVANTIGDSILMGPGTFLELHNCAISVGVSIKGIGTVKTIIICRYTTAASTGMTGATLQLLSNSLGTNGNQSISYLTLNGDNWTGCQAISVRNRNDVTLDSVKIDKFNYGGVSFLVSSYSRYVVPSTFMTGSKITNSIILNCGGAHGQPEGNGLIYITTQDSMTIAHNTFRADGRPAGQNGNVINAGGSHFKHIKYHGNTSWKLDDEVTNYGFHLEFWNCYGGMEIDSNAFHGGTCSIDAGGDNSLMGTSAYSWSMHDNTFSPITPPFRKGTKYPNVAIILESINTFEKCLIYNNTFNYGGNAIGLYSSILSSNLTIYKNTFNQVQSALGAVDNAFNTHFKKVYFYHNVISQANNSTNGYIDGAVSFKLLKGGSTADSVFILNNTFTSDNIVHMNAVYLGSGSITPVTNVPVAGGVLSHIDIKNNIMVYFTNHGPIQIINAAGAGNVGIDNLHIEKNLSYNLASFNITPYFSPYNNGTLTHYTYNDLSTSNSTQLNPLFVNPPSDYSLQSTSPARNAGLGVGLSTDIVGRAVPQESIPDIGAYEYYVYTPWVNGSVNLAAPLNITSRTIQLSAATVLDGGGTISERGICYSTSANPSTSNTKILLGSGLGTFTTTIKNLNPHTTYHFRSYCINESGTAYSDDVAIMTSYSSTINYNGKTLSYYGKSFKY